MANKEDSTLPTFEFGTAKTLEEAVKEAEIICKTSFVPKAYQGKPYEALVAIQMGREVGLKAMQALQSIAVINGHPTVWGDGALGLVRAARDRDGEPLLEYCKESYDPKTQVATCAVKRRGQPEIVRTFSWADALKAKLDKKDQTPWQTYPVRMLGMRARAWALRDGFADVLKGLSIREEVEDYDVLERMEDGTELVRPKRKSEREKEAVADPGGQGPAQIPAKQPETAQETPKPAAGASGAGEPPKTTAKTEAASPEPEPEPQNQGAATEAAPPAEAVLVDFSMMLTSKAVRDGQCGLCGKVISKGETYLWHGKSRKAYHLEGKCQK